MTHDDRYDDEYDDDEDFDSDFDDSDAYVKTTNGYVGDAEQLLRRAIDVIATAPTMPLSSSQVPQRPLSVQEPQPRTLPGQREGVAASRFLMVALSFSQGVILPVLSVISRVSVASS